MKQNLSNSKPWLKRVIVLSVIILSVLNLSIDFSKKASGDIDLNTISITSLKAVAQEGGSGGSDPICRCHTSDYTCQTGSWFSFRPKCNCLLSVTNCSN